MVWAPQGIRLFGHCSVIGGGYCTGALKPGVRSTPRVCFSAAVWGPLPQLWGRELWPPQPIHPIHASLEPVAIFLGRHPHRSFWWNQICLSNFQTHSIPHCLRCCFFSDPILIYLRIRRFAPPCTVASCAYRPSLPSLPSSLQGGAGVGRPPPHRPRTHDARGRGKAVGATRLSHRRGSTPTPAVCDPFLGCHRDFPVAVRRHHPERIRCHTSFVVKVVRSRGSVRRREPAPNQVVGFLGGEITLGARQTLSRSPAATQGSRDMDPEDAVRVLEACANLGFPHPGPGHRRRSGVSVGDAGWALAGRSPATGPHPYHSSDKANLAKKGRSASFLPPPQRSSVSRGMEGCEGEGCQ